MAKPLVSDALWAVVASLVPPPPAEAPAEAGPEGIVVVRDELSFQREVTTIDFESLPSNGSSCPAPFQPVSAGLVSKP